MRLHDLLAELGVAAGPEAENPEIAAVTHDSRRVVPGSLFVTWRGERHDGADFAAGAVRRGAVAVCGEGEAPAGLGVPWVRLPEPRRALGTLAAKLHGHPDREMTLVGVTGTNGKSTVVALVEAIVRAAGLPCARFGTLGYRFGDLALEQGEQRTTPEACDLFASLAEARRRGAAAAAMEVSSHALVLHRVEELRFDVAVFTNLTRDHLDFHRDEASYAAAKEHLFDLRKEGGRAVVWVDDAWGREIAGKLGPDTVTVGQGAAIHARSVTLDWEGIRAEVVTPRGVLRIASPLLGSYNLANLLLAVGVGEALELPAPAIAEGIVCTLPLPGRMERVPATHGPPVLVDYSHTPAALEAAIRSLRELGPERLVVVFGCGGDRDRGKRAPMGRIAGEGAELPIATSDNPRSEDPRTILDAVEAGLRESGNPSYRIVEDRREAIRLAISEAGEDDAVLIAGKGHEAEQILGTERRPFSDRDEARAALENRRGAVARG